jgi:hypothetical protein
MAPCQLFESCHRLMIIRGNFDPRRPAEKAERALAAYVIYSGALGPKLQGQI